MVGNIVRLDGPLFYRLYPELTSVDYAFLKEQWALITRYITGRPDLFTNPGINEYIKVLAHVVKLNLMAQTGMKIDGFTIPVLSPPATLAGFKAWLEQTQYGRSLGRG